MDRKTYGIGILSLTAVVLFVANLIGPRRAIGEVAVNNGDYQVATARVQAGGDALYILDNSSGKMAVFTYDNNARMLRVRAVKPIDDAFNGRGGGARR